MRDIFFKVTTIDASFYDRMLECFQTGKPVSIPGGSQLHIKSYQMETTLRSSNMSVILDLVLLEQKGDLSEICEELRKYGRVEVSVESNDEMDMRYWGGVWDFRGDSESISSDPIKGQGKREIKKSKLRRKFDFGGNK